MSQILVVDDEAGIRELLSEILRDEGHHVRLAQNVGEARLMRDKFRPDLVLLDIWMPDADGITLLKEWASTGQLNMPVVMMSGHGTIDTAVEATRIGAYAFLEKPIALQKLLATVGTALKQTVPRTSTASALVTLGRSRTIDRLRGQIDKLRGLTIPVLFAGEPGSGTEQCARVLHEPNTPWVEPEDFAVLDQPENKLIAQGTEGILFLREVGDLSPLQQNNLRAQTERLDALHTRLLSTTSMQLAEQVAQGKFDARLYGVLAGVVVQVPSLRARAEDVPELANLALLRAIEAKEVPARVFNTAALNALRNYHWPGNLVQLESVIRTVALLTPGMEIGVTEINEALLTLNAPLPSASQALPFDMELREARENFERIYFEYHLSRNVRNMSEVAQRVGLERTHLYRKLKQLGVRLPRKLED
jgi:two-component system, NtrC family, nitrogen regulation response regulator NtrX